MGGRLHGVLLALSGEDADLLRAIDAGGTGLRVVRRCADTAELLSAAMAGLASLVVVDTGFDELDRSVLERLERTGAVGVVLTAVGEAERWASTGWPVEDLEADPAVVRARLQQLARAREPGLETAADPLSPGGPPPGAIGASGAGPGAPAGLEASGSAATTGESTEYAGAGPVAGGDGGLVVVWGPHGSTGRTTIAASLAHGLTAVGGSILVDADLEAPCLTQVLGMQEDSSGLATAARLAGRSRLDMEALDRLLTPVGQGERGVMRLLSGLGRPGRWRELPPSAVTEVWNHCRRAAAWTVVDTSGGPIDDSVDEYTLEPGRGAVTADLVRGADVVVVVGGADPVGVRRLLQLLGDLDEDRRPAGRIQVVVTRVRSAVAGPSPRRAVRDALQRYGGLTDVVLVPDDPTTADRCLMEGLPVSAAAPGSALGQALAELVDRVDPDARASGRAARAARRRGLRVPGRGGERSGARPGRRGRRSDLSDGVRLAGAAGRGPVGAGSAQPVAARGVGGGDVAPPAFPPAFPTRTGMAGAVPTGLEDVRAQGAAAPPPPPPGLPARGALGGRDGDGGGASGAGATGTRMERRRRGRRAE